MQSPQAGQPPTLTTVQAHPLLYPSVEQSLAQQHARIASFVAASHDRPSVQATIMEAMHTLEQGLIAVEGPPGSGTTTLLAHLAATQPYASWFYDEDISGGAAALCAQIIALHDLDVPLIPPSAATNPRTIERLLEEAAARRSKQMQNGAQPGAQPDDPPIVLLIDPPTCPSQPRDVYPFPIPATLPPHTFIIYACTPNSSPDSPPDVQIVLPSAGEEVEQAMTATLQLLDCPSEWHSTLFAFARGNFLALRLACRMMQHGVIESSSLTPLSSKEPEYSPPSPLDHLYQTWWSSLDEQGQRLALLLGAMAEPLPIGVCQTLLEDDASTHLAAWEKLGILLPNSQDTASFAHWTLREYLIQTHGDKLTKMHETIVELAMETEPELLEKGGANKEQTPCGRYLTNHFARHAALGTDHTKHTILPKLAERAWINNQERRNGHMAHTARDLAWELRTAAAHHISEREQVIPRILRLVRAAVLAGTLSSLARTMDPNDAVGALEEVMKHNGREQSLKLVLNVVGDLADGKPKANIYRKLGEMCYHQGMRNSAMRLLGDALDLEEPRIPRSWTEERDHLLSTMVQTALSADTIEAALNISEYIHSNEQRGMAETHIVRHLILRGELTRARRVACNISHESLTAWAQAEVAVAVARSGDLQMAELLLDDVQSDTATSWAQIELASDMAATNEEQAQQRIEQLDSSHQRDHGRARLSQALARAGKGSKALAVIEEIQEPAEQIAALLDLRNEVDTNTATLALKKASQMIGNLKREERVPLMAMLAASYAFLNNREQAIKVANRLPEGEERVRALSRVAVALAYAGDYAEGLAIAWALEDDDERDWTLDELTTVLANAGRWQEAQARAQEISDVKGRARTLTNLSIALARLGAPLAGLQLARSILDPSERGRALLFLAPLLIESHHSTEAISTFETERAAHNERLSTALDRTELAKYLVAVATSLAEHGEIDRAEHLAHKIGQEFDRAKVYLAIAKNTAKQHEIRHSYEALGNALCSSIRDREAAFELLGRAVPVFMYLGDGNLLLTIAEMVHDLDTWW